MLKQFKADSAELDAEEKDTLRQFDLNVLEQLDKQVLYWSYHVNHDQFNSFHHMLKTLFLPWRRCEIAIVSPIFHYLHFFESCEDGALFSPHFRPQPLEL